MSRAAILKVYSEERNCSVGQYQGIRKLFLNMESSNYNEQ